MAAVRPPYDPRSIANTLLDAAWRYEIPVTHLSLQKTIYFLHAQFLRDTGTPLCRGYFEAWKHGPVHPQIWSAFKSVGRSPIRHHAYSLDISSGLTRKVDEISDTKVLLFLATRGLELLTIPAPRLVGMSHLPGGAWDKVTRISGGQREYGARISDELILKSQSARIATVREIEEVEEDLYEQPPT